MRVEFFTSTKLFSKFAVCGPSPAVWVPFVFIYVNALKSKINCGHSNRWERLGLSKFGPRRYTHYLFMWVLHNVVISAIYTAIIVAIPMNKHTSATYQAFVSLYYLVTFINLINALEISSIYKINK